MNFLKQLRYLEQKQKTCLCIGIDNIDNEHTFDFAVSLIQSTHDLVSCYKINTAFYESKGSDGIVLLKKICDFVKTNYSHIPLIIDAKRGDVAHTNEQYAQFVFEYLNADAVTLSPYLGKKSLQPFLDRKDKGCIFLCKTSNPGSEEIQNLPVHGMPLYLHIARIVSESWNVNNNCLLVAGATYPQEIAEMRKAADSLYFLIPGIGFQGGSIEQTVRAAKTKNGSGMIISVSRSILNAKNPRKEALRIRLITQNILSMER